MSSTVVPRNVVRILVASALFTLWSATLFAATATGVWVGTLSANDCGSAFAQPVRVTLYQSGDAFDGFLTSTGPRNPAPPAGCTDADRTFFASVTGTVAGSTVHGTLETGSDQPTEFIGTLLEQTMTLQGNAPDGAPFKIDLTKTSEVVEPPFASRNFAGTLSAQENVAATCSNMTTLTWSGPATANLLAIGGFIIGSITTSAASHVSPDAAKVCTIVPEGTSTVAVYGEVTGNSVAGIIIGESATDPIPFTATYSQNGTVFDGTATNATFNASFHLVATAEVQPPQIMTFTATPSTIRKGQSATLSWQVTGAVSASIDNGVGIATVPSGSTVVSPQGTTKYTLTAMSSSGVATGSATVTVDTSVPAANVGVSTFPGGMLQVAGGAGASTYYVLRNTGGADTSITLSQNGNFFTQAPSSFTLRAGSSQVVTITALEMPSTSYVGTSLPAGTGVPSGLSIEIRLVVAPAPTAPVTAGIYGATRVEVAATSDTNPTGTVSFTNSGTGTLYGLLSSDVPWIIPYSGIVEIPAGATRDFTFTADRSRRPDAAAALGGLSGVITLTFFSGSGAGKGAQLMGTTPTSSVSVNIVDVVKPGVAPGTPPALSGSEVGLFVAGIASKSNAIGDLVLSNAGGSAISDLKLFFSSGASGSAALQTQLGSLASNAGVAFPGIVKNVFSSTTPNGVVQIRSSQSTSLSVSAVQVNPAASRSNTTTALPVLRSDRAATAGSAIYLPGVRKDSVSHTDLYVQEVTGNAATVTIDYLDAGGNVLSSRPADSLAAFGMLQLSDGVPANAKSVRVRNTSSGSAKIGAFALVVDDSTGDSWSIVDNASASFDTLYFPVPAPVQGVATREFAFTNSSTSPVNVTLTLWPSAVNPGRRRASVHSEGPAKTESVDRTLTIAPLQTVSVTDLQSGFAKASTTAGALHGGGMYTVVRDAVRPMGTAIPAVTSSWALSSGSTKRFTGVEDASIATVSTRTPSTYRTHLLLYETGGQSVTVRLTLRYLFAAGSLVSSIATSSREITLGANAAQELKDVGTEIIGNARSSYGDLHNMQLDVAVVSGSGKVIAFLETVDNASGDVTIRE